MNQLYAQDWKNDVRCSMSLSCWRDSYFDILPMMSATQAVSFFA